MDSGVTSHSSALVSQSVRPLPENSGLRIDASTATAESFRRL